MGAWLLIAIAILTEFLTYHYVYSPLNKTLNNVNDAMAKNAVKNSMLDAIGLGSDS